MNNHIFPENSSMIYTCNDSGRIRSSSTVAQNGILMTSAGSAPEIMLLPKPDAASSTGSKKKMAFHEKMGNINHKKAPFWDRHLVEIMPGTSIPLHGSAETQYALKEGRVKSVSCLVCSTILLCIQTASMVVCPHCHSISPIDSDMFPKLQRGQQDQNQDQHDHERANYAVQTLGLGVDPKNIIS